MPPVTSACCFLLGCLAAPLTQQPLGCWAFSSRMLLASRMVCRAAHSRVDPGQRSSLLSFFRFSRVAGNLLASPGISRFHVVLATWALHIVRDAAGYLGAAAKTRAAPLVPFPFVRWRLGCPASCRCELLAACVPSPHFSGLLLAICRDFRSLRAVAYIAVVLS